MVGDYVSDIIVEGKVLVELKVASGLSDIHSAICINYLKCAKLPVCLLFNFGTTRLQFKRFVSEYYDPASPL
jgi:GxxExxY protein